MLVLFHPFGFDAETMTVTDHRGGTVLVLAHVYLVERDPVEASA